MTPVPVIKDALSVRFEKLLNGIVVYFCQCLGMLECLGVEFGCSSNEVVITMFTRTFRIFFPAIE